MIQIRKANIEDKESIKHILCEAGKSEEYILDKLLDFSVCQDGSDILGCACGIIKDEAVYISFITVRKAYRKQKIGSSIVKAILNTADLSGVKRAYMLCDPENFAKYLRFERLECKENNELIRKQFNDIYHSSDVSSSGSQLSLYWANLEGYFKPCCNF